MSDRAEARYEGWEWWWECPHCDEGHTAESDIRNTTMTCPTCGKQSFVGDHETLPAAIDNDIRYRWECPSCEEANWDEDDPRNSERTCEVCGLEVVVTGDI